MQRTSEFPLFFQTAIAIFGFIAFLSVTATLLTPTPNTGSVTKSTIEVARNR